MVKVRLGDLDAFSKAILKFLEDERLRKKIGKEAKEMIEESWDWKKRASGVVEKIIS